MSHTSRHVAKQHTPDDACTPPLAAAVGDRATAVDLEARLREKPMLFEAAETSWLES